MPTEQQAQFKNMVRDQWSSAAEAWQGRHKAFSGANVAITGALLEAADIAVGHNVLDLACGTGDPALTIADRVGPSGSVVCTDLVPQMLSAAEENAGKSGLKNMSFELADMEELRFEDNTFDRVTCRFGIMFPPDHVKALREIRRVLKPGGRAAFVVWAPAAENPNFSVINAVLQKHGLLQQPPSGAPTPFTFAEAGSLSAKIREAGFSETHEEKRELPFGWPGAPEEHIAFIRATLPNVRRSLDAAPSSVVDEMKAAMAKYYDGKQLNYGAKVHVAWAVK
jgi:ubiquinone/menaquinone biosynthesis C-methylase UbiE